MAYSLRRLLTSRTVTRLALAPVLVVGSRQATTRALVSSSRKYQNQGEQQQGQSWWKRASTWGSAAAIGASASLVLCASAEERVDYAQVRRDIEALLDDPSWDDGSWGPVLVRLAWHASGTYDICSRSGGSNGATMRFPPECNHGANAGLAYARERLESVKQKHPNISYADLWTLAGTVAIERMGGPDIRWRRGRSDAKDGSACPPDGRLPDASLGNDHTRSVFYRMGFNDREIVALLGAHVLGRCHTDRSGFSGPWTNSPITFSNDYFVQLLENKWTPKKWNGPAQFEDKTGSLMMLPTDYALLSDPVFSSWVRAYAENEDLFFRDFAFAWQKLMDLGVPYRGGIVAETFF